ncbi:MAG TPA: chorismate mutase [Candidatus Saccharimonadales bacterium]|nr:chorismate mutase [Candidatus Saccharimonadales bacterium]
MSIMEVEANREVAGAHEVIEQSRERITAIDDEVAQLLVERHATVQAIALARRVAGEPLYSAREQQATVNDFTSAAEEHGIDRDMARRDIIHPLVEAENKVTVSLAGMAAYEGEDTSDVIAEGLRRKTEIDLQLIMLIAQRKAVAEAIGEAKKVLGLGIYNEARELEVIDRFIDTTVQGGVSRQLSYGIITRLIQESRSAQSVVLSGGEMSATQAEAIAQ